MLMTSLGRLLRSAYIYSFCSGLLTIAVASIVLLGWWFSLFQLTSLNSDWAVMVPSTAFCFVLMGIALCWRSIAFLYNKKSWGWVSDALAFLVIAFGVYRLLQVQYGWTFLEHGFLFADRVKEFAQTVRPVAMAPATASCFILTGILLFLSGRRMEWVRVPCALGVFILSGLVAIAYAYGAAIFSESFIFKAMAFHTASIFLFLISGIFLSFPFFGMRFSSPFVAAEGHLQFNERLLYTGFGVAIIAFLAVGFAFSSSFKRMVLTSRMVNQTFSMTSQLDSLLIALVNAETGQRGYILTGKEIYLEPYDEGRRVTHDIMKQLEQQSSEIPYKKEQIGSMKLAVTAKLDEMQNLILMRREKGFAAVVHHFSADRGKILMDKVRGHIAAIQTNERNLLEAQRVTSDRETRKSLLMLTWGSLSAIAILVMCLSLYLHNNKKRYEAEERLRESENLFHGLFEFAPDAIVNVNTHGQIVRANTQVENVFGWKKEEVLGKPVEHLMPMRNRHLHVGYRTQYMEKPKARPMGTGQPLHAKRKDGSEFPVAISLGYLETKSEKLALAVIRDITREKDSEEQIRNLNEQLKKKLIELEVVNKELNSFSYSVSHDLRAPLRSIAGFSQILLEDHEANLNAEGKDYLQRVITATKKMGQLIDGLLDLSRLSRKNLSDEVVDLSEIGKEILRDLQDADKSNRHVAIAVADNMKVHGDAVLLKTALQNLLENAWKFTSKTADAHIEFSKISKDGKNVFCVKDNGAGFDMRYSNKLFETFQRLHSDNEFLGTGVGLATVRRILLRHEGDIWAESQVGKGTTFYFTLAGGEV